MTRRLVTVVALCLGFVALGTMAAYAAGVDDPPPKCFRSDPAGDLPTCTWDGRTWSVSYDTGPLGGAGPGVPSGFVALFVIVALGGVGLTLWRVSLARGMAREAGMDPDRATAVTLLSDDGLDATYLASSLRDRSGGESATTPPARTVSSRLRELQELRDQGLVTHEEYETRRKAIVDSV